MQCQQFDSGPLKDLKDEYGRPACLSKCEFEVVGVEKAEDYLVNDERLCTFIDDDECRYEEIPMHGTVSLRKNLEIQKCCPPTTISYIL